MKRLFAVAAVLVCVIAALCSCIPSPYDYYCKRALEIPAECGAYSLKAVKDLTGEEQSYVITDKDYVSEEYLLNPSNDGKPDYEIYNDNGLYVYFSNRKMHLYCKTRLYDLDESYFIRHSDKYVQTLSIWADKYGIKPADTPNYVLGALYFDGCVFILTQNRKSQSEFDREYTTGLWKFDYSDGKIQFCGFCSTSVDNRQKLCSLGDNIAVVKN